MDIVKNVKEVGNTVEEKLEHGLEVAKGALGNVASHLPFANLSKSGNDTFNIEVDLPGVKKEDIDIKVENNYLIVNAIRKMTNEVNRDDYYLCESSFGRISRSFLLPSTIDSDKVEADLKDGRLYIRLEKEESKKVKSISIK